MMFQRIFVFKDDVSHTVMEKMSWLPRPTLALVQDQLQLFGSWQISLPCLCGPSMRQVTQQHQATNSGAWAVKFLLTSSLNLFCCNLPFLVPIIQDVNWSLLRRSFLWAWSIQLEHLFSLVSNSNFLVLIICYVFNYITHMIIVSLIFQIFSELNLDRTRSYILADILIEDFMCLAG